MAQDHDESDGEEVENPNPIAWGELRTTKQIKKGAVRRYFNNFDLMGMDYSLGDVVYFKPKEDAPDYIGKLLDLWDDGEGTSKECRVRWFFRPNDDIKVDKRGLRGWQRALRELPEHKQAHREKQVFLSFNEQKTDTDYIEETNDLQAINRKIDMVCTAKHPNCREPTEAELTECDHWFNSTYCSSARTLVNSLTGVFQTLSAEIVFNEQYRPIGPRVELLSTNRPAKGVLQPANYHASSKAKRYPSDSDSEEGSDAPLARPPRKETQRFDGSLGKGKEGSSTHGKAKGSGAAGFGSMEGGNQDRSKGLGGSQVSKSDGGEEPVKKLKVLKKVGDGGLAQGKETGGVKKDGTQLHEKLLEQRRRANEASKAAGGNDARERNGGEGLVKKPPVYDGPSAKEKDRSVLGKRPALGDIVGPKGIALGGSKASGNGSGGLSGVQRVGESERPSKLQKMSEKGTPKGWESSMQKSTAGGESWVQKQKLGDKERQNSGLGKKEPERLTKPTKPVDPKPKTALPSKGDVPQSTKGAPGVKPKNGVKRPGDGASKPRAEPLLTKRERKAELLRVLEDSPIKSKSKPGGGKGLESASDSSDSDSSSSDSENERRGKSAAVKPGGVSKQGPFSGKPSGAAKPPLSQPGAVKRTITQEGGSGTLKKSDSFREGGQGVARKTDAIGVSKKSESAKETGAGPVGRTDSVKPGGMIPSKRPVIPGGVGLTRQDSGQRPKKPELQKQGSTKEGGERTAVAAPRAVAARAPNFLGDILGDMQSTFKSPSLYEESDEMDRVTKVRWAEPLTQIQYFLSDNPESDGAEARAKGGNFLERRSSEAHVGKDELFRAREELRRLEERGYEDSPRDTDGDWVSKSATHVSNPETPFGTEGAARMATPFAPLPEARESSPDHLAALKNSPRPLSPLGRPPVAAPIAATKADPVERKASPSGLGPPLEERKRSPSPVVPRASEWKPLPSPLGPPQNEKQIPPTPEAPPPVPQRNPSPVLPPPLPRPEQTRHPSPATEPPPPEREPSPAPPPPEQMRPPPPPPPTVLPPPPPTASAPPQNVAPSQNVPPPQKVPPAQNVTTKENSAPPEKVAPTQTVAPPEKVVPPTKRVAPTQTIAPPQKPAPAVGRPFQKQDSFEAAMRQRMGGSKEEQELREQATIFAKKKMEREAEQEKARELAEQAYHPALCRRAVPGQKDAEAKRKDLQKKVEQKRVLQFDNLPPDSEARQLERSLAQVFTGLEEVKLLPALKAGPHVTASAVAVFDTRNNVDAAAQRLKGQLVCIGHVPRPIVGRRIQGSTVKVEFPGPISIARPNRGNNWDDKLNAIAVAHASQPNTIEFEFGVEWRLLQMRAQEAEWQLAKFHASEIEALEKEYREARKKKPGPGSKRLLGS